MGYILCEVRENQFATKYNFLLLFHSFGFIFRNPRRNSARLFDILPVILEESNSNDFTSENVNMDNQVNESTENPENPSVESRDRQVGTFFLFSFSYVNF